jgi:hypothetical protein
LVTADGEVPRQGSFRDTLLDTLAVLNPSRSPGLESGLSALGTAGGQLIAVLGDLSAAEATELSAARRGTAPGIALVLAEVGGAGAAGRLTPGAQVLVAAGWRVAVVPDAARLAPAWHELHQNSAAGAGAGFGTGFRTGRKS